MTDTQAVRIVPVCATKKMIKPVPSVQPGAAGALDGALVTVESFGSPDPSKRRAEVRIVFSGDGALSKAHRAAPLILALQPVAQKEEG